MTDMETAMVAQVVEQKSRKAVAIVLDKIKAEIDEQYDRVHPYNISCAEGLEMALNIIDKYRESIGAGEE